MKIELTSDERKKIKKAWERVIKLYKNQTEAAFDLRISRQQLNFWKNHGCQAPADDGLAIFIEQKTFGRVKRWELNPIAYPPSEYKKDSKNEN